ncbi:MAG: NUDIX domain-containing protein [Patescibacteria group bacterium]|nr:NUDIX domain-containing protein [Patescibacteria group bacterium]
MKNKSPKIIIIEGIWTVGKSTVIFKIRSKYPVLFIPEPNHIKSGIKSGIAEWYKKQHAERMDLAKTYCSYGENTVMERSIISSAALFYAQHCSIPDWFKSCVKKISSLKNLNIIFLFKDKRSFLSKVSEIENKEISKMALSSDSFYKNYNYFYTDILPGLVDNKILNMKVSKNRSLSSGDEEVIKKIFNEGRRGVKNRLEEKEEYCASAIIFHKNKFLTLYSSNHRQYVFPQGHQENNEDILNTNKREVIEETGFKDFKIISPIKTYSYRFYNKGKIIHKIISCFLIKLETLKKTKKKFEDHESYRNYFFTIEEVIKKLSWAEDKEMVSLAQKIIIKNPPTLNE